MQELNMHLELVGAGRMPAGGTTDLPPSDAPHPVTPGSPPFCQTN